MNIANGSCGSVQTDAAQTARIRREEARRAAEFLGATFHESLTHDLEIFYDRSMLLRLSSIVRDVAPSILLTHSPQDYMEDHMNACRLALTAAFSRGMPNFPVEPPCAPTDQQVAVYHAQPHGNCDGLGIPVIPELFVDVGSVVKQKSEMLACHESQKHWLDQSQGMGSYLETMMELAREIGRLSGEFQFAEGWRRHMHLGYCEADFNPLLESLKDHVIVSDE
jgi:LmbE family N-acetylglucosaminyl deacetylase